MWHKQRPLLLQEAVCSLCSRKCFYLAVLPNSWLLHSFLSFQNSNVSVKMWPRRISTDRLGFTPTVLFDSQLCELGTRLYCAHVYASYSDATDAHIYLVLCQLTCVSWREMVWWMKSFFWGLFPKSGRDIPEVTPPTKLRPSVNYKLDCHIHKCNPVQFRFVQSPWIALTTRQVWSPPLV